MPSRRIVQAADLKGVVVGAHEDANGLLSVGPGYRLGSCSQVDRVLFHLHDPRISYASPPVLRPHDGRLAVGDWRIPSMPRLLGSRSDMAKQICRERAHASDASLQIMGSYRKDQCRSRSLGTVPAKLTVDLLRQHRDEGKTEAARLGGLLRWPFRHPHTIIREH